MLKTEISGEDLTIDVPISFKTCPGLLPSGLLVFWSSQEWAERVEQQMTRFMDFLREKGAPRWMTWRMGAEVRPGWLEHVQHEDG